MRVMASGKERGTEGEVEGGRERARIKGGRGEERPESRANQKSVPPCAGLNYNSFFSVVTVSSAQCMTKCAFIAITLRSAP